MINANPQGKLKLICFDLDGTIADTEPLQERSKDRLARSMGYTAPINFSAFVGKPNRFFWEPILSALGRTDVTIQEMEQKQLELIIKLAREERLPSSEGLCGLLEQARATGIPMAVCTSSKRFYADRMLELLALDDTFDFVVGGDEVPRMKPAPDVYLAALRHFGVDGSDALALEDSAAGVMAAKAAGLFCVGYRNPTSGEQDISLADWKVGSLAEIIIE